jgi:hypothetical protein
MVDEGRVLRLLRSVTDDVAVLQRESIAGDAIVVDRLGDLSDLEEFVGEVAAYVTTGNEAPDRGAG